MSREEKKVKDGKAERERVGGRENFHQSFSSEENQKRLGKTSQLPKQTFCT